MEFAESAREKHGDSSKVIHPVLSNQSSQKPVSVSFQRKIHTYDTRKLQIYQHGKESEGRPAGGGEGCQEDQSRQASRSRCGNEEGPEEGEYKIMRSCIVTMWDARIGLLSLPTSDPRRWCLVLLAQFFTVALEFSQAAFMQAFVLA